MPSTGGQKVKVRRSRETDLLSDFDNMNVVLGDENSNPIEQELENNINGLASQNDTVSSSNKRGSLSQESEIRALNAENGVSRQDRFMKSMEIFSNKLRFS